MLAFLSKFILFLTGSVKENSSAVFEKLELFEAFEQCKLYIALSIYWQRCWNTETLPARCLPASIGTEPEGPAPPVPKPTSGCDSESVHPSPILITVLPKIDLMLPSHLRLDLPSGRFLHVNTMYVFLFCRIRCTCLADWISHRNVRKGKISRS